jgi:hypothetical protein
LKAKLVEYVLTTLAEYQTAFWIEVAENLVARGHGVSLISFDDNSTAMLRGKGLTVYAATADQWKASRDRDHFEERLREFGLEDTPFWLTHEKYTFLAWDEHTLEHRLAVYLDLCETALADVAARGREPVVIQELGGFLSVIAAFFAARKAGAPNWFIEPSFFKGRCFWLKDTFAAKRFEPPFGPVEADAEAYLAEAAARQTIVIPLKDAHHYALPFAKVATLRNLRRLTSKLIDKYVLGKRQEFGHVFSHASKNVAAVLASAQLEKVYTDISNLDRIIYYPLHVPADMALTLRSPTRLDQLALIEALARQLPRGWSLAIKEHPAMIGAVGAAPLKRVLKRNSNIALLNPRLNNYEVLRRATAVVSVNSKSGAEALLLGKPVFVLGDAFYGRSGLCRPLASAGDFGEALRAILAAPPDPPREAELHGFFSAVWRESHPGELYVSDRANVDRFTMSLLRATGGIPC